MEKINRNIIIGKVGGNAGDKAVSYKISFPAKMVKDLGVTLEDRAVLVYFEDNKIITEKNTNNE